MSTPAKRLPGDRTHLARLLDAWARDTEEPVTSGRLRRLVGVTAIIQMLDGLKDEAGQERIAFKGGAALELRFGFRARASNDLDGAYRGEVSEAIGLIDEGVRRGWSGFTGRTSEGEPIVGTGLAVAPVRFRVRLLYKNKDFVTVPMELSPVEGRSLDQVEVLPAAVSLEPVQLTGAEAIPFLPLRYQVAQKLHACTEDVGEERPNQRARDLADILLIEELALNDDQMPGLRDACVEIFGLRGKHLWPPVVVAWPGWDVIWGRLMETERLDYSIAEAVVRVQDLVDRIDSARP
ncbi:MAG: nucleotidyl transferase AbiEii/AbiGii toxin family protein [Actinomycetota bacterium]|nr:nucleotidyl transferase AbiEii/AbiGii toxin family protein [Actinomycetota bacterium]